MSISAPRRGRLIFLCSVRGRHLSSFSVSDHPSSLAAKPNRDALCCSWYPRSSLDRLLTMAWFSMWLFIWDDVVEDSVIPESEDDKKVDWLQDSALKYVEFHLGLSDSAEEPPPPTKYCTIFKHAGAPLRADSSRRERQMFHDKLKQFMDDVKLESVYVRNKQLPTIDEYWRYRLGGSSVYAYCAIGE